MHRATRVRAGDGKALATARQGAAPAQLLARHYRQLRTSHGTVLLGAPPGPRESPPLDSEWFVTGCPLEPEAALEAIRKRHGFATRDGALRALRAARDELAASQHPDAEALAQLPG